MSTTTFFRLLSHEDKGAALADAVAAVREEYATSPVVHLSDPQSFDQLPGSTFAYWATEAVRRIFSALPPFESAGRTAKQGLATADDYRFVRLWWEVAAARILDAAKGPRVQTDALQAWCRQRTHDGRRWVPFAKGGEYSPYYADVYL